MDEYSTAVSLLPWHNADYQQKAVAAAKKAEGHIETMKLHFDQPQIYTVERRRMFAQTAVVQRLWNADMDQWLIATIGKAMSQVEATGSGI